jgi:hypothetical protein
MLWLDSSWNIFLEYIYFEVVNINNAAFINLVKLKKKFDLI